MNSGYPRINKKKRRNPYTSISAGTCFPLTAYATIGYPRAASTFLFLFLFWPGPHTLRYSDAAFGIPLISIFPLNAYADNRLCEPKQRVEILWCDFSAWWHVELHICKKIRIVNTNSWAKKNPVLYNIFRCTWGSIHLQYSLVWCCRWLETKIHMVCCTVLVVPLLRCFQKTNEKNT